MWLCLNCLTLSFTFNILRSGRTLFVKEVLGVKSFIKHTTLIKLLEVSASVTYSVLRNKKMKNNQKDTEKGQDIIVSLFLLINNFCNGIENVIFHLPLKECSWQFYLLIGNNRYSNQDIYLQTKTLLFDHYMKWIFVWIFN
jgi:hypothetical protein